MKSTYTQGRYKTCTRKNTTPKIDLTDDEGSNSETFFNIDASQRFSYLFYRMSMISEHGFILDKQEENIGLLRDIEFYANSMDTNNKRDEVVVRGVNVSYSKGTINMNFDLSNTEDRYQELLDDSDDGHFDVYMKSLCNIGIKLLEYV
ncbi:hypothetical protein RYX36_004693, partial [Vicia faba]